MALFGNDYDRDYGYRGTYRDNDRGYRGDNPRYGTTGFGNTGWGTSGYATGRNDYDTGYRSFGGARESFNDNRDFGYRGNAYGTGYGNAGPAYGPAYGAGSNMDYDRDYGYRGTAYGYDHNMKSRAQTDRGDPYGDRAAHTPVRVMRGGYERNGMGIDYDRQYKEGLGDDPYYNRGGMNAGGMYRGNNMYDRGYRDNDRGWF